MSCMNYDINVSEDGTGTLAPGNIQSGEATDNCGVAKLELDQAAFSCQDVDKPTQVTLKATDASGNEGTCDATVTARDKIVSTFCFHYSGHG